MGTKTLDKQLVQVKEMIDEEFKNCNDELDLEALGERISSYRKLGGDPRVYEERYIKLLELKLN